MKYSVREIVRDNYTYKIKNKYVFKLPAWLYIYVRNNLSFYAMSLSGDPERAVTMPVWHSSFGTCTGGTVPIIESAEDFVKARDILVNGLKRINMNSLAAGSVRTWLDENVDSPAFEKVYRIYEATMDRNFFEVCRRKPIGVWEQ